MSNSSVMLKLARKKIQMSQNLLADKLGLESGQFISNIERGLCRLPKKHFAKACKILKIDPEALASEMASELYKELLGL